MGLKGTWHLGLKGTWHLGSKGTWHLGLKGTWHVGEFQAVDLCVGEDSVIEMHHGSQMTKKIQVDKMSLFFLNLYMCIQCSHVYFFFCGLMTTFFF